MPVGQAFIGPSVPAQVVPLQLRGGFLELALLFVVLAVVAAILGAGEVAGFSWRRAKILVVVFIVLAVVSLVL